MRYRRFPPIGALFLMAALATTLGPGAWASHDSSYAHNPEPVVYGDTEGEENNPTCAWLGQQRSATWNELKVDQAPPNGTYDDQGSSNNPGGPGALVLTVKNSDGSVIDWESNIGVDAFVVKGGNRGSNVYFYDPEAAADERLHSPLNSSGNVPQISHISVCYDEEQGGQQGGGGNQQGDGGQQQQGGGDNQQQGGGDNQQDNGGEQQRGGEQNERPQDDGGSERRTGDGDQQGGGQEQQNQGGQQDGGGNQRRSGSDDGGGGNQDRERVAEDEVESERDSGESDRGDSDVLGESESDDGIAEEGDEEDSDDDEDDEDDERDEHPFTGASTIFLLMIGLTLVLTGLTGRRVSSR